MNMIKKYSPSFYLALIFVIGLLHCTNLTLGDHLAADFPPEVSECTFFGDLNQPDQMVRSSKDGEPWVICIGEQLSLIGTDSYPLTDNYILAEDLDAEGEELPPMGDESRAFTGTFDGNGRRITNFQIPAEADAILGYLPLGSYDENAVFTNMPGAMTPQEVCDRSSPRPASTAPIRFNPHEEGGGNRLICQADQLSDTAAYIRTTDGLGEKYILVAEGIDLAGGELPPIGDGANSFTGTFDGGGQSITNFTIPAGADAILGYLPLGSYDENAAFLNLPGAMKPQEVCDRSSPRPASTAPIRFNPHEEGGGNRLICQADQLSDTAAYIRTTDGLGEKYILVAEGIDLAGGELPPIGDGANSFTGTFDGGGQSITNFTIPAGADAILGYLPLGSYDEDATFTNNTY